MPGPRTAPRDRPDPSRREFLTTGLGARISGLLGGGAALAATAEAAPSPPAALAPGDLTRIRREGVRAALARIRARRRGP